MGETFMDMIGSEPEHQPDVHGHNTTAERGTPLAYLPAYQQRTFLRIFLTPYTDINDTGTCDMAR